VAMRGELGEQVILHADRGCQYTSAQLARFAREHNLTGASPQPDESCLWLLVSGGLRPVGVRP